MMALTLALAVLLLAAHAHAAVLLVDDDGMECPGAPFTTVQDALQAASPGDTVRVCAGVYNEAIVVDKPGVILDGQGQARVTAGLGAFAILVAADGVRIEGFHIFESLYGIVAGDPSTFGPGVSGLTVSGNTIYDNVGDGVLVLNCSDVRIVRNVVRRNGMRGIDVQFTNGVRITNNLVSDNEQEGIEVDGDSFTTRDAVISHNLVERNALGIVVTGVSDFAIANNTIRRHFGTGVIVFSIRGLWLVERNRIVENGAGMEMTNAFDGIVRRNAISLNGIGGGLLMIETSASHVSHNTVHRNAGVGIDVVFNQGGDVIAANSASKNAGVDCRWDGSDAPVFVDNLCGTEEPAGAWE